MNRITGAFVIRGTVTNTSPIVMGTGRGESIDIEMIRGYVGDRPYIPATSLTGVLRHRIAGHISGDSDLRFFWGGEKDSDSQSHFIIEDLVPEEDSEMNVSVRNGIRINDKTGIVEKGAMFTWEVLDPGARFRFHAEALVRESFDAALFSKQIGRVLYELSHSNGDDGLFAVGAMTTKGFGRIKLEEGVRTWRFDFNKADHARHWLEYRGGATPPDSLQATIDPKPGTYPKTFSISAEFGLKSSLIIGSYTPDPVGPDKVHLSCNGKNVISGTSLKGALRARATKIINTFGKNGAELLKNVFGWAENTEATGAKPIKSRLFVGEPEIVGGVTEVQSRVKIDRFTGGALESALYDSMPVWETEKGSSVTLTFSIEKFKYWEAGLLLHLLKDLWTGDLPVGGEKNVGRGLLKGRRADIIAAGQAYTITQTSGGTLSFSDGAQEALEAYAAAFAEQMKEADDE